MRTYQCATPQEMRIQTMFGNPILKSRRTMRLFVTIPIPKDVIRKIEKYRDKLGRTTPWMKWTSIANLHVTAHFLGNISVKNLYDLILHLKEATKKIKCFPLSVKRAVYAPLGLPAKMVWLTFRESEEYRKLAHRLGGEGSIPHITLARFRKDSLPKFYLPLTGLEEQEFIADSCILMESILSSQGPTYDVIQRFKFG